MDVQLTLNVIGCVATVVASAGTLVCAIVAAKELWGQPLPHDADQVEGEEE